MLKRSLRRMMVQFIFLAVLFGLVCSKRDYKRLKQRHYQPTWESIDSRPIPEWYRKAKFGIFCHWGVYSVPAYRSEWLWWYWKGTPPDKDVNDYINKNYKPGTKYADFANEFTAEFFDARVFKEVVASSGARYFVFTSKHHEGYTMWPSPTSWNWNSVDVGPHRDIVGELYEEFVNSSIHFGLYFSQFEWFNPMFLDDCSHNNTNYVNQVSYPQMIELVNKYTPEVIWSDGDWGRNDTYWRSKEFLAWLYNESPVKEYVVVNDRWGDGTMGKHGGFLTYSDHYDPGHLMPRKWENCMTLDVRSWGFRRDMRSEHVHSVEAIIEQLVRTIACNGNLLLNVGPDMHGMIPAIFEDRLRELGVWVRRNSEAIFDTYPWMYQNDSDTIWYTVSVPRTYKMKPNLAWTPHVDGSKLYAFLLQFPQDVVLTLPSVLYKPQIKAEVLVDNGKREAISVSGKEGEPVALNFSQHQRLAALKCVVVCIENFAAEYRDPIRHNQGAIAIKETSTLQPPGYLKRAEDFR